MDSFLVAAVQMKSGPDKGTNLEKALEGVEEAAAAGAQLIALPEVFSWRGSPEQARFEAETIPGPTSEAMSGLARRLGIHLVAGSILERTESPSSAGGGATGGGSSAPPLPFNTTTLFGPDGRLLGLYRKI